MGLFGKKKWDEEKDAANKAKLHALFEKAVDDHEGYKVIYAYNEDVKTMNFVVARKTTYTYKSIALGFRESDMSIVLVDTVPELDAYGEVKKFTPADLKKAKRAINGEYYLYKKGGMMAGYEAFTFADQYDDENLFAYMSQKAELDEFETFWKKFREAI